jgi:hypothetical protein
MNKNEIDSYESIRRKPGESDDEFEERIAREATKDACSTLLKMGKFITPEEFDKQYHIVSQEIMEPLKGKTFEDFEKFEEKLGCDLASYIMDQTISSILEANK